MGNVYYQAQHRNAYGWTSGASFEDPTHAEREYSLLLDLYRHVRLLKIDVDILMESESYSDG